VQKFDIERFNLRKQNDVEVKEHYQVTISNRFAVLENLMMVLVVSVGLGKVLEYKNFRYREFRLL
jgi:hypothetical protein